MTIPAVTLTYLIENSASTPGLASEHGLAVLVEASEHTFLFNTGASPAFLDNADLLGIDLSKVEAIALSHGHYDHTGGLEAFLERFGGRPVWMHPAGFEHKTHLLDASHSIGMPQSRARYEELGAEFYDASLPLWLASELLLSGEIPRKEGFPVGIAGLGVLREGKNSQDPLLDDLSLFISLPAGIVVQTGCAHSGVLNILAQASNLLPEKAVLGIFGGTHLVALTPEQVQFTLNVLLQSGLQWLGACHCTGEEASKVLAQGFGERFARLGAGSRVSLWADGNIVIEVLAPR